MQKANSTILCTTYIHIPQWRQSLSEVAVFLFPCDFNLGKYVSKLDIMSISEVAIHVHPFNLHPEKQFEGYSVKSTQIFIGVPPEIFFRMLT